MEFRIFSQCNPTILHLPKINSCPHFYLQYISTVFPFILIGLTWISIDLYSRNFKIVVWIWRTLNNLLLKHIKVNRNTNRTVIDAYATFFLLSYAKLVFVFLVPLYPTAAYKINVTTHMPTVTVFYHQVLDPTLKFLSKNHIPYVVVSILF